MNISAHSEMAGKQAQHGLTIVEILIAVAVISVLFLVSSPFFSYLTSQYHLKNTSKDLMVAVGMAQIEAERRYSTVRICPSSDGMMCRKDGNWNEGWLVFSDGNENHVPDRIEILEYFPRPNENVHVQATGAVENIASFNIAGLISENGSAGGSFKICQTGTDSAYSIINMEQDGVLSVAKSVAHCDTR